MAQVMNGWSFNSLESDSFQQFCTTLRADYVPPKRRPIQTRVTALYEKTKCRVEARLRSVAHVFLAVDGWEDHQKCPVLGMYVLAFLTFLASLLHHFLVRFWGVFGVHFG